MSYLRRRRAAAVRPAPPSADGATPPADLEGDVLDLSPGDAETPPELLADENTEPGLEVMFTPRALRRRARTRR